MPGAVVITAHGKVINAKFTLNVDVLTCSKIGEYHYGKMVNFVETASIFERPESLYHYVIDSGDNYLNKGSLFSKESDMYQVILTPLKTNDPVKTASWQRPYITKHLTKMCVYQMQENPV